MSITVSAKTDYSYLFSSLSTSSSSSSLSSLSSLLSDYSLIKSGSYGKLMKAYYTEQSSSASSTSSTTETDDETTEKSDVLDELLSTSSSSSSISTSSDSTKVLAAIEESADDLKESADVLMTTGTNSVFKKEGTTVTDEYGNSYYDKVYDTDEIYDAVSAFVDDYNSLIEATADSSSESVERRMNSLLSQTTANKSALEDIGITVGEDNTLVLDEETFKAADMDDVKSLFNGSGAYAYQVSAQASLVDYAAEQESSKANTYTSTGTYSSTYSTGSIYESLF